MRRRSNAQFLGSSHVSMRHFLSYAASKAIASAWRYTCTYARSSGRIRAGDDGGSLQILQCRLVNKDHAACAFLKTSTSGDFCIVRALS